jgi:RimJ/RimL family protein N-acetyltransferase
MKHLASYINWAVASSAASVRAWLGDERLRSNWSAEFDELVHDQLESADFGPTFVQHCPSPGAVAADYLPRELDLGDGLSVLAGIHKGSFFFVNVYAQTRLLRADEVARAGDMLRREFAMFEPAAVRWWEPAVGGAGHKGKRLDDLRLIVGWIPELLEDGPAPNQRVRLQAESSAAFHDDYLAMYERFFAANPAMRDVVRTEDREDLQACADVGALFRVLVDDAFAGVIAAAPSRHGGVDGWSVNEELLDTAYRGQGLAVHAQRAMLAQLDQNVSQLVFGTINAVNQASVKTALRVGRQDAGGWVSLA